jgi:TPR repeat protein
VVVSVSTPHEAPAEIVEAVSAVLDTLGARGLVIDTVQRTRIFAVLARMAAAGRLADERLAGLLTPILAGTPAEQKLCHEVFAQVLRRGGGDDLPPIPADAPLEKDDLGSVRTEARGARAPLRRWWLPALLLAALTLLVGGLLRFDWYGAPAAGSHPTTAPGTTIALTDLQWLQNYPIEELEPPKQRPWNRSARWYYTEYDAAKWAAVLLPCLVVALGLVLVWRRMVSQLRRDAQHESLRATNLNPGDGTFRFGTRRQNTALQPLRKLPRSHAQVLDVEATARASAEAGGLFQPRYALVPVPTDFVALIDRQSANDHLTAYNLEVCRELRGAGLSVDVLEFNLDPSICRAVRSGEYRKLGDVIERFSDAVLLLFADAEALIHPASNQWLPALDVLLGARRLVLFTPRAGGGLSPAEKAFARRFRAVVHRTDPANWPSLVESLVGRAGPAKHAPESNAGAHDSDPALHALLHDRPGRWIQPSGVHGRDVADLTRRLRPALSEFALSWLAVTAVYPVLRWPLTLAMRSWVDGRRIARDGQERALLELCRLPWFRHGAFPEWMRREFLRSLREPERDCAIGFLRHLLGRALGSRTANAGPLQVDLDSRQAPGRTGRRPDRVMMDLLLRSSALPSQLTLPAAWLASRWRRLRRRLAAIVSVAVVVAGALVFVGLSMLPIDECDLLGSSIADAMTVGPAGKHHELHRQVRFRTATIQACERATSREPTNGRYWYQLARALNQSPLPADLRRALDAANKSAARNYPAGFHLRGHLYADANKLDLAESDFRKAISLGNISSWSGLSNVAKQRGDRKMEYEFIKTAVELGASPVFSLAWHYREGIGAKADPTRYLQLLRLGLDRRDGSSAAELGYQYRSGLLKDSRDNDEQAVKYYRLAIEWSLDDTAASNLAELYRRGDGVERSAERATYWRIFAAKQGNATALSRLADMMVNGEAVFAAGHAPPLTISGSALLERTAKEGNVDGQYLYARWLENSKQAPPSDIIAWYRKAAGQGHANASLALKRLTEKDED